MILYVFVRVTVMVFCDYILNGSQYIIFDKLISHTEPQFLYQMTYQVVLSLKNDAVIFPFPLSFFFGTQSGA